MPVSAVTGGGLLASMLPRLEAPSPTFNIMVGRAVGRALVVPYLHRRAGGTGELFLRQNVRRIPLGQSSTRGHHVYGAGVGGR